MQHQFNHRGNGGQHRGAQRIPFIFEVRGNIYLSKPALHFLSLKPISDMTRHPVHYPTSPKNTHAKYTKNSVSVSLPECEFRSTATKNIISDTRKKVTSKPIA